MKKFSDNISTGTGAESTPDKPGGFSAGIVEGQDKAPEIRKLKAFSDDISTGVGAKSAKDSFAYKPSKKEIIASRKAVVKDLLAQGLKPKGVLELLLTEPDSDWTEKEVKDFLIELGVPKKELWQESLTEELRSFSDGITSGLPEEMQEQPLKVDTSKLGTKTFKYSTPKIAELRMKGKGFSDATIKTVEKLGQKPPEEGYSRITDPKDTTKWTDAWCTLSIWGFVDIKKGFIHEDLPWMPLPHSEMAEVSTKGLSTTSFKYSASKMNALRQQGFKDSEIRAIEKLGQEKTPLGHERFTDSKNFIEGTDAWHMVTTWGFVDIDRGGFIHRVFPLYAEDPERFQTDIEVCYMYAAEKTAGWEKSPEAKSLWKAKKFEKWEKERRKIYDKAFELMNKNVASPKDVFDRLEREAGLDKYGEFTRAEILKMKPEPGTYYFYTQNALKALPDIKPYDIHLAVERAYTEKPLTSKDKEILQAGWPHLHGKLGTAFKTGEKEITPYKKDYPYPSKKQEPNTRVPQGENYLPGVGWY